MFVCVLKVEQVKVVYIYSCIIIFYLFYLFFIFEGVGEGRYSHIICYMICYSIYKVPSMSICIYQGIPTIWRTVITWYPFFFFFFYLYMHIFLGNTYMWRTVITWFPSFFFFFFFIIYIREYLQCGEQSSPGIPFFFFF